MATAIDDLRTKFNALRDEVTKLRDGNDVLTADNAMLTAQITELSKSIDAAVAPIAVDVGDLVQELKSAREEVLVSQPKLGAGLPAQELSGASIVAG